jgi:TolA-binding protein
MPELDENVLADVLADVLTENIELDGDALLEEILEEEEEPPEPPEEPDIPPQPAPEMYLLPRPSVEPNLPPKPSDENHPPDPSEVIHHSLRNQMDEIVRRWNENDREHQRLRDILKPYISRQENLPSDPQYVSTLFGGKQEWERISYDFSRAIGASWLIRDSDRVDVLALEQHRLHNQARELWRRSFELYRQEGDRYRQWVQDYNRRAEEYNAAVNREKERINRQVDEFNAVLRSEQERVKREQKRWQDEVRQKIERFQREQQEYREKLRQFQEEQQRKQQERLQRAEKLLESRAETLLDQAQYQVCQASLFSLPSTRPARQGGSSRPRSNSPPPLNDAWIRRAEAKLRIGDHNNFIRTSVRRMLRDGCGLSQRTAQNLGDSAEYVADAAVAYFLGGLSKVGKAAGFAGRVIKAAAQKVVGKVEVKLREPPPAEGERGAERIRDFGRKQGRLREQSEQGQNEIPRDIPRRNPNEKRKWKRDLLERGKRFYSDPRNFERFEGRAERADVDHRHELQLGGQDIRNNFTLTESGVNRSVGAQIRGQTRGRPPGTRVDFE